MPTVAQIDSLTTTCGNCGATSAMHTWAVGISSFSLPAQPRFLQCPGCGDVSVQTGFGHVSPGRKPSRPIKNLPTDVETAWSEARSAFSVSAFTASEIMCRKILMHVAVDVASSKAGKSFVDYIDDLEKEGYITKGLKGVVDLIRKRGNIANHELPASTETEAMQTVAIVEHLLHSIYELPALATP